MTKSKDNCKYLERLKSVVLPVSHSDVWEEARQEWFLDGFDEDTDNGGVCQCSKTKLRHLFSIKNKITDAELFPIGSSCIKLFENNDMNESHSDIDKMNKMANRTVRVGRYKGKLFSDLTADYISFLRSLGYKKYATYNQIIEYDDLRKIHEKKKRM